MHPLWLLLTMLMGCGRIGFDAIAGTGVDGGVGLDARAMDGSAIDGAGLDGAGLDGSPGDGGVLGPPTFDWALSFATDATAWALAADAAGNVYCVGTFAGAIDFGGGSLLSAGLSDGYVASFDQNGAYRWGRIIGAAATDSALGVAVDPLGETVVVVGELEGRFDFGPTVLTTRGADDGYVLALDTRDGTTQWVKQLGGTGDDRAWRVALTTEVVYVVTFFTLTGDFGAGPMTSGGGDDLAITALARAAGAPAWARQFGSAQDDYMFELEIDPATGDLWLAGETGGAIDFGGGPLPIAGRKDCIVARLTSDGAHRFSRSIGGPGQDGCEAIEIGPGGVVYVAGWYDAPATFDGFMLPFGGGPTDGYVLSLDSSGSVAWVSAFGAGDADEATDIALGPSGGPIITGWFGGTIDLGGTRLVSAGALDVLFAELAPDGTTLWATALGTTPEETGSAVVRVDRNVYLNGGFDGATTLGGGAPLPFSGVYDNFLARFTY